MLMIQRADLSGSTRIEIPEVPVRAMKEAIINSLCHRDFYNPKTNEIAIYRDRIEIYNPGQFPFDHDPDEFIAGHGKSYPRNPLIAEAFYLAKDIERWGSGLRRIKEECDAAGVKVAFEKVSTGFQVTFYRPEGVMDQVVVRKGGQKRWSGLTKKQTIVLEQIEKKPEISRKELAHILGINPSAVQKHIQGLKDKGYMRRIGPDKGGHWEVVKG